MRACARACVRARVHACVRACVCACERVQCVRAGGRAGGRVSVNVCVCVRACARPAARTQIRPHLIKIGPYFDKMRPYLRTRMVCARVWAYVQEMSIIANHRYTHARPCAANVYAHMRNNPHARSRTCTRVRSHVRSHVRVLTKRIPHTRAPAHAHPGDKYIRYRPHMF